MVFSHFFLFVALGFSLAAPLGPVNIEMIKVGLSKQNGWILSFVTGLGATSCDFIIATTLLFIASSLFFSILEITLLLFFLFLANSLLLFYIGYRSLMQPHPSLEEITTTSPGENTLNLEKKSFGKGLIKQYGIGFIFVLTSPWSYLWWLSFGSVILSAPVDFSNPVIKLLVISMFIVGVLSWCAILALLLLVSSNLISKRFHKTISILSATFIFVFAANVLLDAIWIIFYNAPLKLLQTIVSQIFGYFF